MATVASTSRQILTGLLQSIFTAIGAISCLSLIELVAYHIPSTLIPPKDSGISITLLPRSVMYHAECCSAARATTISPAFDEPDRHPIAGKIQTKASKLTVRRFMVAFSFQTFSIPRKIAPSCSWPSAYSFPTRNCSKTIHSRRRLSSTDIFSTAGHCCRSCA